MNPGVLTDVHQQLPAKVVDPDSNPCIACHVIRDCFPVLLVDRTGFKLPPSTIFQNRHQLSDIVLPESDASTGLQSTVEPSIKRAEHVFLSVGNENHREVAHPVKIVQ